MQGRIFQIAVLFTLLLPLGHSAHGQVRTDTLHLQIFFHRDKYYLDYSYQDNGKHLADFKTQLNELLRDPEATIDNITVRASASPEGYTDSNKRLSENRAATMSKWLQESAGISQRVITLDAIGEDWSGFERLVGQIEFPWKNKALAIIRDTPEYYTENGHRQDARKRRLKSLDNGKAWEWMDEHLFPELRTAGGGISCVVTHHVPAPVYIPAPVPASKDTVFIVSQSAPVRDTVFVISPPTARDTVVIRDTLVIIHEYPVGPGRIRKERKPADQTPSWALKTNLLLLGVLAPNIEAEFPLGTRNRWSIETEFIFPWWTFSHNAYAEQVLNLGVEMRYWLGDRKYHRTLDGFHLGLALAAGYYDLEWKSKGYQGEHVNAYFNAGYQHRWGKRQQWAIDAGLGAGALITPRHRYYLGSTLFPENHTEEYDDHLMYQNKGSLIWPGPVHVNVSLGYMIDFKRNND